MNREFTKRDSATAFLRKNKIQKDLYSNFITKINGKFVVNTKAVDDFLSGDKPTEQEPKNVGIKVSKEVVGDALKLAQDSKPLTTDEIAKKKVKPEDTTVSSLSRKLILDGKTNKEVWAVIKAKFKLEDNKKHYPAWYRSEMKRSGKLK
jgi:hypothetical protein